MDAQDVHNEWLASIRWDKFKLADRALLDALLREKEAEQSARKAQEAPPDTEESLRRESGITVRQSPTEYDLLDALGM